MRTFIKVIAVSLGMVSVMGTAHANGPSASATSHALHRVIAAQGDQALSNIRSALAASIPQSFRQQLNDVLEVVDASAPRADAANSATESHRAGSAADSAAVVADY